MKNVFRQSGRDREKQEVWIYGKYNYGGNIGITGETLWTRAHPYSLRRLHLMDIPKLVELPSSIKNFTQLEQLIIQNCINLEPLPTDINFYSLRVLRIYGSSWLKIFPNISTNIEELELSYTGIENFTKLKTITMMTCSKLVRVSLNIYKLKLLERADFLMCWALSEASWNDHPIAIHEVLSGVEVPLHFIHQTTGYSLTNIPLRPTSLSQQLFKFRACVVVVFEDEYWIPISDYIEDMEGVNIDVRCEFKDRIGNSFVWVSKNKMFIRYRWNGWDSVVFVLDSLIPLDECNAPLAQLNYDHVDMEIISISRNVKFKRWGVQLLDESSSPMTRLSNPHVCEDNLISESEHNEECIQTVGKRQREAGSMGDEVVKAEHFLETLIKAPEEQWSKLFLDGLSIGKGEITPDELSAVIKK